MHPGMGYERANRAWPPPGEREVREPAYRGHRVGDGRDAGVEPGQRVAGISQRHEQHRQVRAPKPIAIPGCG